MVVVTMDIMHYTTRATIATIRATFLFAHIQFVKREERERWSFLRMGAWKLFLSPFSGLDMLSRGFTWHAHRGVAMRQDTDKPTLVADKLAASCRLLVNRIHERFPDRGIDVHANRLADYAERLIQSGSHSISAPVVLRIVSWMGGIAAGLLLISPVYFVRRMDGIDVLPEYLQSLDACITVLAATVAGFFTMRSIEHGVIRRKALKGLHTLRSYAHVTDMLQISKSPTRLLFPMIPTKSTLAEEETVMSMSRYLCYCGELYAMIAKLAAIYGEWTSDGEVLSAIDDVEGLCSSFENKTMQKILLLEQLSHRVHQVTA